jgi:hypothetical protein
MRSSQLMHRRRISLTLMGAVLETGVVPRC